jgi:hypothetical protein
MPDADVTAALSHALIECDPCGPVVMIVASGVGFEVLEGSPVLHDQQATLNMTQEAAFGMFCKFLEHSRHGEEYG